MWRAESSAQGQAAAPIAEEVRAFEFVIDGALGIAAGRGREHPQSVARELVEMVMRGTAGDGAAEAERKRLAPQVAARHPLASDDVMDAGARSEADRAAADRDAREELGVLARDRIVADHAKILAEAAEELEGLTPEADVGAEIIVDVIALRLLRAGDRGLVVDREAYVQARPQPS